MSKGKAIKNMTEDEIRNMVSYIATNRISNFYEFCQKHGIIKSSEDVKFKSFFNKFAAFVQCFFETIKEKINESTDYQFILFFDEHFETFEKFMREMNKDGEVRKRIEDCIVDK